jgi:hypothetical protein
MLPPENEAGLYARPGDHSATARKRVQAAPRLAHCRDAVLLRRILIH